MSANMWDEKFKDSQYFYGTFPNEYLASRSSGFSPKSSILCLGEGEGRNAVFLASKEFSVTAMDYSAKAAEKTKYLADLNLVKLKFIEIDLIENSPLAWDDQQYDIITLIWFHLPRKFRANFFPELIKKLKPNGQIVLECYSPLQLSLKTGGPKEPDMLYEMSDLEHFTKNGMGVIHANFSHKMITEGNGHRGLSHSLQAHLKLRPISITGR